MTMARIHSWFSISLEVLLVLLSVIVIYFLTGMILSDEPRCSKFNDGQIYSKSDIELKTFEKLVRLEHKFEILEKKLQEKTVQLDMAEAKKNFQMEEIKKELNTQQNNLMEAIKRELDIRQRNGMENLKKEIGMQQRNGMEDIKKELDMRQKNHNYEVGVALENVKEAFEHLEEEQKLANDQIAANFRTSGLRKRLANGRIILEHTDKSTDRGYNESTGYFTVPITGIYLFYAEFCTDSIKSDARISIMKNEEVLGSVGSSFRTLVSYYCDTVFSIALVSKRDKVWLKSLISRLYLHPSTFSGVLLFV